MADSKSSKPTLEERFWSKVDRQGPDDCWLWLAHHGAYGFITIGSLRLGTKRKIQAHRMSWTLANGPIPSGLCVCHRCDTPLCVNPNHLFLGTHADNKTDSMAKLRHQFGSRHHRAKLTPDLVAEIRRQCSDGATQTRIAEVYGMHVSTINQIMKNRLWKSVEGSK